ncbi:hypothetical protein M271_49880 [Streptomyces rapamycinicus NRRL 5491]|uniref:Uncharacterized protein n=1 Tax=Streptomyces rapamycinicus (strain ATCC 29253 / DSM 41530 / NRRL 5491 / AYB-994) TaxID=1343740 RepID=A0A0A0NP11_STRRN|nr:hypothetical protein [Streptomyces rapamycinicus]AGP61337.1 hypothetical protein M271_49880 [Streptomyces rapamycinicus NRRL 5491]RLV71824.1 hypothetical protein D3C57_144895 [Streptomyces rapamycinicus NRRL 5491]
MAAFGITRERVLAHQWVDNGPGWAVVQLAGAEEVLALEPDLSLSALMDVDLAELRTRLLESRNRIAAAAGIPLDGTWRPRPASA